MTELVAPTERLHAAWLEARAEWGPGVHEDGFGLDATAEVVSSAGFARWIAALREQADPTRTTADGKHRCTFWWIVESDRVLGGVALREGNDDYVRLAGHLGFGIRPSARRRGLGMWAVGRLLQEARVLGLQSVLAVCDVDNVASASTIERCGGVLEGVRDTAFGPARRYWLTT